MSQALLAEIEKIETAAGALRALVTAAPAAPPPPAPQPVVVVDAPVQRTGGLGVPAAFYAAIKASDVVFGGKLTPAQFAGCEADLQLGAGRLPLSWMAYCLATDYHETGHTMQPERERGSGDGADADPWDDYLEQYDTGAKAIALGNTPEADGDGITWAGRGKVQITGHTNYAKADARLHELGVLKAGESLLDTPDLALRLDVAAATLVVGMLEGWFTGKKLNTYLPNPARREHFAAARRIVNGTDRADLVAGYAMAFQDALRRGAWT